MSSRPGSILFADEIPMIISASRRTDIPAFFGGWFLNRLREGYALVRNPMNARMVSRVRLDPGVVDCIVFWTKDPSPLLPRLPELDEFGIPYYFLFTVNCYGADIETHLPERELIVEAFLELAERVGKLRVIWRYDPIFYTREIGFDEHCTRFAGLAGKLKGKTDTCIVSFLTPYSKCLRNLASAGLRPMGDREKHEIAVQLRTIAGSSGMKLRFCAADPGLDGAGSISAGCIDTGLISSIAGETVTAPKDRGQRPSCRCARSIDVGAYNTCMHGCLYCYASTSPAAATRKAKQYDPHSALLMSTLGSTDIVRAREATSFRSASNSCAFR